jgi:hypothetical protein
VTYYQQLSVVLGPVLVTAVLGPVLLLLLSKARKSAAAQADNYEALSDKARFEAMDLLVNHMRAEVDRLQAEARDDRLEADQSRKQIRDLENRCRDCDRLTVDLALWALSLVEILERAGFPVASYPDKIHSFLERVQAEK